MPVSATVRRTRSPSRAPLTLILPPAGVNLIAFSTRLVSTCSSAPGRRQSPADHRADRRASPGPPSSASGASLAATPCSHRRQRHFGQMQLHPAGLHPGELQQVVNHALERRRLGAHGLQKVLLHLGHRAGLAHQDDLDEALDRVQRRAQLVADDREEVGLHPLQLFLRGDVAQHGHHAAHIALGIQHRARPGRRKCAAAGLAAGLAPIGAAPAAPARESAPACSPACPGSRSVKVGAVSCAEGRR